MVYNTTVNTIWSSKDSVWNKICKTEKRGNKEKKNIKKQYNKSSTLREFWILDFIVHIHFLKKIPYFSWRNVKKLYFISLKYLQYGVLIFVQITISWSYYLKLQISKQIPLEWLNTHDLYRKLWRCVMRAPCLTRLTYTCAAHSLWGKTWIPTCGTTICSDVIFTDIQVFLETEAANYAVNSHFRCSRLLNSLSFQYLNQSRKKLNFTTLRLAYLVQRLEGIFLL